MKHLLCIVILIVISCALIGFGALEPNEPCPKVIKVSPTEAIAGPDVAQEPQTDAVRKIVMPKDIKLPVKYKCQIHGRVDSVLLNIDIDGKKYIYCKKCAMQLIVDIFDLNLPKLEIVK